MSESPSVSLPITDPVTTPVEAFGDPGADVPLGAAFAGLMDTVIGRFSRPP